MVIVVVVEVVGNSSSTSGSGVMCGWRTSRSNIDSMWLCRWCLQCLFALHVVGRRRPVHVASVVVAVSSRRQAQV